MPWLSDLFRRRYLDSLDDYKSFYDDLASYGNPAGGGDVFYFVPGFNGVPGQVRFALPSLTRLFGGDFHLRSLHHPAFSAREPIWDKYTPENVAAKRRQLVRDLTALCEMHDEVSVLASSSGFYDFLSAYHRFSEEVRSKLRLIWIACAPDWAESSPWEPVFYKLNGFESGGFSWFCYPNHNALKFINNECSTDKKWRLGSQKKTFFKNDLESRFVVGGLLWDCVSIGCYNWHTATHIEHSSSPIDIPAIVMVATEDGYWQGKGRDEVERVVRRYLSDAEILYRPATHLWVTVPEHITDAFQALGDKAGYASWGSGRGI